METVESINKTQPLKAVEFCEELIGDLKNKQLAVLGLAFKADTDDMREARAIPIIKSLVAKGAKVTAYDPVAIPIAKTIFKNKIRFAVSIVECLRNADCCILVTEWDEFKRLKPKDFIKNMKQPALVDGRRIYDAEEFSRRMKFRAVGLGL